MSRQRLPRSGDPLKNNDAIRLPRVPGKQRLFQLNASNKKASQNATWVIRSASCANAILRCKGLGGLYISANVSS